MRQHLTGLGEQAQDTVPLPSLTPPVSPSLVRLSLLGGLRIERHNEPSVSRFQTQKTAALLAYLALHPDRSHGREFLIDLFWPDVDLENGRRSLRTALTSLRRQLEPPGTAMGAVLIADRATVRLNPVSIETDVARFVAASRAGLNTAAAASGDALETALVWYRGPLLPGFYDEWLSGERERLADLYRDLLLRRAAFAESQDDLGIALDYARQAVNLEEDRESRGTEDVYQPAHIAVIRLLGRTGRPDDARRHFDLLGQRLRDLYDEVPSPDAYTALGVKPELRESVPEERPASPVPVSATAGTVERPISGFVRLPSALTRFFGRGPERDLLESAFADAQVRLITLTGPGGVGKTRLAIEWGRHLSAASPTMSACFVPLADLTRASHLWLTLARTLDLEPLTDPAAVRSQVCDALNRLSAGSEAPFLLVLDNFETLVDAGAPLVESLLQTVPRLRVLVTSRRPLHIGGEREIPVGPLPVPPLPGTPARLLEWASVQLFVDRAQAARPDFQMTPRNAEGIASLCRRLDGIPLALEITAAWAGALSSAQMLERVNAHLLDESGPPQAHQRAQRPNRHRTLRAALDASFSLLPSDLQVSFKRLSVFRGGWTLEAAESILMGVTASVADVLTRLRERSLIVVETAPDGDSLRFHLLPVLREYADEALEPDERETTQEVHAHYFLRLVEGVAPGLSGPDTRTHADTLETEHDNIRAALDFYLTSSAKNTLPDAGLRLAGAMEAFWQLRGYWDEGIEWLSRALEYVGDKPQGPDARAAALQGKGRIAYQRGDYTIVRPAYEEALAIWRGQGNEAQAAKMLHGLAGLTFHADSDYARARALVLECLEIRRRLNDPAGIAAALSGLGTIASEQGDYEAARAYMSEAIQRERELGNPANEALATFNLGNISVEQGRLDEAQALYEKSLQIQLELGNKQRIGHCWAGLGSVATDRDDYPTARACYEQALLIARELGETWAIGILLNNLAKVAYYEKDLSHAESLGRESLRIRVEMGDRAGATRVLDTLAFIAATRPDTRIRAAVLWGGIEALRNALQLPIAESLRAEYEAAVASLRADLGASAFEAAWTQGAAFTFNELVAYTID